MNQRPEPQRIAIHQAGHAVVQTLVGRGRFGVARLVLGIETNIDWPGREAWGASILDQDTLLNIYEFGLVTLAGVAAEERYLADLPPEKEPLVALSDIAEWNDQATVLFKDPGKLRLVSLNVMRKLHEWFAEPALWRTVEAVAEALLEQGELDHISLQQVLNEFLGQAISHPAG